MNRRSFLTGLVLGPIALKLSGKMAFGKSEPTVYTQNISSTVSNEVRPNLYIGQLIEAPSKGDLWWNGSTVEMKIFDGLNWIEVRN